jgi:CheY-like chemotaxis protein
MVYSLYNPHERLPFELNMLIVIWKKGTGGSGTFSTGKGEKMNIDGKLPTPKGTSPLHGVTILVVEDDQISAKYLDKILCRTGAEYKIVASYPEMQEYCETGTCPNVVLLDIALVGADGFDCLKWLHTKFADKEIVYIAQTAHVLADEALSYAEAGFDDFIGKPYKKEELISIILANL